MLEIKDDMIFPPSQIELDSLLAWRLQAEEYKCVYQVTVASSFLPVQKFTLPSYQFENSHGEVVSFTLMPSVGDGDSFFQAVDKTTFTRDILVQKLLDNPTETVRYVFAYEIRQFLYLGINGIHSGQENEACQRLLTSDIRERFLTLQKTEGELRVKIEKVRLALGKKETHGKRPLELLALLSEKSSVLTFEFRQAYQTVLQMDSAIYQYCYQEDVFKNYVQFYLKEARGYIPFSPNFNKEIPVTTVDVINQLLGLKIQAYLALNRSSMQLQLANQLQTGEVISIFHNGINHFGRLAKQKPLLEPERQTYLKQQAERSKRATNREIVKLLRPHLEKYPHDIKTEAGANESVVSSVKFIHPAKQKNAPVIITQFNQFKLISQNKPDASCARLGLQISPVSFAAASHVIFKERNSDEINLTDEKEEKEKMDQALKALRPFFMEEQYRGKTTENYLLYNEYLKKGYCDTRQVYKLRQTNIPPVTLVQNPAVRSFSKVKTSDLKAFLKLVAKGKQDKAEVMLKKNPALALVPGDIIDLSKRRFTGITGFQYAVWALDWHMWEMIRKYLSDDTARVQAQEFETGSWVTSHGVHAQWLLDNLSTAYETTLDLYRRLKYKEANRAWIQQVGGAQRLLPAHVVHEYCNLKCSFYPLPNFKDAPTRSCIIKQGDWFTASYKDGMLGDTFAVYRGSAPQGFCDDTGIADAWAQAKLRFPDHMGIMMLTAVRTTQRTAFITQLGLDCARSPMRAVF